MTGTFFDSYLAAAPAATALLPGRCCDPAAWLSAAGAALARDESAGGPARAALVAELRRQSEALPASAARERHLDALGRGGASVVVTGQQVGLFLGPLYALHKAATAVARARWLTLQTGRPCLPVFWLQSEDHDWAEIAHAEVALAPARHRFELPPGPEELRRVSLAQRTLPAEVDGLVARLGDLLAPLHHGAETAALIARHYVAGRGPVQAFAGLLAELFAPEGLLLLDPRTPALARLAAPVLARTLDQHREVALALAGRARELAQAGFAEQVRTRPEASLVFFHPRGPAGPRYRLVRDGDGWSTPEGTVAHAALLAQLEADPLWFSTSALLRPLVQDTLLPTCAYVGGPAECTYFAQLPPLYGLFGLPMPLVAPRARLRIVDDAARSLLEKLQLAPEDADLPREELLARLSDRSRPAELEDPPAGTGAGEPQSGLPSRRARLAARLLAGLERELDRLAEAAPRIDPALLDPIRRTRESCQQSVARLVDRVEKAAQSRDQVTLDRLDKLLLLLRPGGEPQERVHCFAVFAARAGPRRLVEAVLEAADSLSPAVRSVSP